MSTLSKQSKTTAIYSHFDIDVFNTTHTKVKIVQPFTLCKTLNE
jgi:hypothetical protein